MGEAASTTATILECSGADPNHFANLLCCRYLQKILTAEKHKLFPGGMDLPGAQFTWIH